MNIIEEENYSFNKYVEFIEIIGNNNPHESNYQALICDFLNKILINTEIQVIDTSANRPDTKQHDRKKYTGPKGTPDLIIARGYQYKNIMNEETNTEYIAAIEIKRPKEQMNEAELIKKNKEQLESHLSKNKKVIITDCIKWSFFRSDKVGLIPVKSFVLKDNANEWKVEKKEVDEFVQGLLNLQEDYLESECKEWNDLQVFIREWLSA
ncbi:hypothetical protein ACQCVK_10700 [Rossellomorea vietnamensis]|uniref:hypothetical protein n=1 Tax=Rossellomorea vietnamensis TaxID=218284 RepID=UPI003CEE623A